MQNNYCREREQEEAVEESHEIHGHIDKPQERLESVVKEHHCPAETFQVISEKGKMLEKQKSVLEQMTGWLKDTVNFANKFKDEFVQISPEYLISQGKNRKTTDLE